MTKETLPSGLSIFALTALTPALAYSQNLEPDGFLTSIINSTSNIAANYQAVAESLFFILIVANMVWIFGKLVLSAGTLGDLMKEFAKLIIFSGMVIALINAAPLIPGFILENAGQIAERGSPSASGDPGEIFSRLMDIAGLVAVSNTNPLVGFAGILPAIVITVFAAGIVAFIAIAVIEAHLIGGVGVVLLAFGGWDLTSDIAKSYLRWALGTALKLVTVFLLAGVIVEVTQSWSTFSFNPVTNIENMIAVMGLMFIAFIMVMVVPGTIQQIASGASFSSSAEAGMSSVKMTAAAGAFVASKSAGPMASGASSLAGGVTGAAAPAAKAATAALQAVGGLAKAGAGGGGGTAPKPNPKVVKALNKVTGK